MSDLKDLPVMEPFKLQDIFSLDSLSEERRESIGTYEFNGFKVPRVSEIIKKCIYKEYLTNWAAMVGAKRYNAIRNKSMDIGTAVHEMVENFLLTGTDLDIKQLKISPLYADEVLKAYFNFKNWTLDLNLHEFYIEEVIAVEKPVVCPYYGGTIDLIIRINGKVYIIDIKTSKQISYEYIIQTCSYMWIVNNGYCSDIPHIDGIGIIRVDKNKDIFEDLFLNESIPYQREIINQYYIGFGALLSSYYNNINMEYLFSTYRKTYDINETINGIDECN